MEKPEVGDFLVTRFDEVYEVLEIVINRDARISSECKLNPYKAYFELKVKLWSQKKYQQLKEEESCQV